MERTYKFKQHDIVDAVDVASAQKVSITAHEKEVTW